MEVVSFELTPFVTNCYVIRDSGEALVIDPGEVTPELLEAIAGFSVKKIVNTHCHCDHCGGNAGILKHTGAKLYCHQDEVPLLRHLEQQGAMFGVAFSPSPDPDVLLNEGDAVTVGGVEMRVLLTPGHSPGHVALAGDGFVFSGDVLFAGSIGRTDILGGNYDQLMRSIKIKLLPLPDDTVVYSGHGPVTTIGRERRTNPFLQDL